MRADWAANPVAASSPTTRTDPVLCQHCGAANPPEEDICRRCGNKLLVLSGIANADQEITDELFIQAQEWLRIVTQIIDNDTIGIGWMFSQRHHHGDTTQIRRIHGRNSR